MGQKKARVGFRSFVIRFWGKDGTFPSPLILGKLIREKLSEFWTDEKLEAARRMKEGDLASGDTLADILRLKDRDNMIGSALISPAEFDPQLVGDLSNAVIHFDVLERKILELDVLILQGGGKLAATIDERLDLAGLTDEEKAKKQEAAIAGLVADLAEDRETQRRLRENVLRRIRRHAGWIREFRRENQLRIARGEPFWALEPEEKPEEPGA